MEKEQSIKALDVVLWELQNDIKALDEYYFYIHILWYSV